MIALGRLYAAVILILLLVALGASIPVLGQIVRDGLERHRERQAGAIDRDTEDEEDDRGPPDALEENTAERTRSTCRQCGAENDPQFTYCRRCAAPL